MATRQLGQLGDSAIRKITGHIGASRIAALPNCLIAKRPDLPR